MGLEVASRSLRDFTEWFWPVLEPAPFEGSWHIDCICDHLEAVFTRQIRRLIINVPPRHCKSRLKVFGIPYRWLHDPTERFMGAVYQSDLSLDDNVDSRSVIRNEDYQALVQDKQPGFLLQGDRDIKSRYDNNYGGYSIATSVGGRALGIGGSIRWVDDPHNYIDPDSDISLEEKVKWFDRGMTTRVVDPRTYCTVVICQRTAIDDLVGHILAKHGSGTSGEKWVLLKLPFRYTGKSQIVSPLHWKDPRRREGELLWQERFPEEEAVAWENSLYEDDKEAQLQQEPQKSGASIVKPSFMRRVSHIEYGAVRKAVRAWDKAVTPGGGCATAGVLMLEYGNGRNVVADVEEGHWGLDDRENVFRRVAEADYEVWGKKLRTVFEEEGGSAGKSDAQYTMRHLKGFITDADRPTGDKDTRLRPFASQVKAGAVDVLDGQDWTERFFFVMGSTYPGKRKERDIPDATSLAFSRMSDVKMVGPGS